MKQKNKLLIKSKLDNPAFRGMIYNNASIIYYGAPDEISMKEAVDMALNNYVLVEEALNNFNNNDLVDIDSLNNEE